MLSLCGPLEQLCSSTPISGQNCTVIKFLLNTPSSVFFENLSEHGSHIVQSIKKLAKEFGSIWRSFLMSVSRFKEPGCLKVPYYTGPNTVGLHGASSLTDFVSRMYECILIKIDMENWRDARPLEVPLCTHSDHWHSIALRRGVQEILSVSYDTQEWRWGSRQTAIGRIKNEPC
jgi:hypothetical protein